MVWAVVSDHCLHIDFPIKIKQIYLNFINGSCPVLRVDLLQNHQLVFLLLN